MLPASPGSFHLRACLKDRVTERSQDHRLRDEMGGIVFYQEDRLHNAPLLLSPIGLSSGALGVRYTRPVPYVKGHAAV